MHHRIIQSTVSYVIEFRCYLNRHSLPRLVYPAEYSRHPSSSRPLALSHFLSSGIRHKLKVGIYRELLPGFGRIWRVVISLIFESLSSEIDLLNHDYDHQRNLSSPVGVLVHFDTIQLSRRVNHLNHVVLVVLRLESTQLHPDGGLSRSPINE